MRAPLLERRNESAVGGRAMRTIKLLNLRGSGTEECWSCGLALGPASICALPLLCTWPSPGCPPPPPPPPRQVYLPLDGAYRPGPLDGTGSHGESSSFARAGSTSTPLALVTFPSRSDPNLSPACAIPVPLPSHCPPSFPLQLLPAIHVIPAVPVLVPVSHSALLTSPFPHRLPAPLVYILDTGVRTTHVAFSGRVGEGTSMLGGGYGDDNGHGTHVAGA